MRMMESKQRSQIFAESSKRGIDNELLHEIVENVTGKTSIKQLTYLEAAKVIGRIQGGCAASVKSQKRTDEGGDPETVQLRKKIYMLTGELGWNDDNNRINGFTRKMFKVDRVEWLTVRQCHKLIETLKKMVDRDEKKTVQ